MDDFHFSIAAPLRAPEIKIKGSRFIADIVPVADKHQVEEWLASIRKEFYDASHHCFAYRIGVGGLLVRAADDGEPNGTAGKPILLVLTSQKLVDILLVVTRYFGGTRLGTGGLARAYAESAQQAVSLSNIVKIYHTTRMSLHVLYEELAPLERLLKSLDVVTIGSTFLDAVDLEIEDRHSKIQELLHAIGDSFYGRVEVKN